MLIGTLPLTRLFTEITYVVESVCRVIVENLVVASMDYLCCTDTDSVVDSDTDGLIPDYLCCTDGLMPTV